MHCAIKTTTAQQLADPTTVCTGTCLCRMMHTSQRDEVVIASPDSVALCALNMRATGHPKLKICIACPHESPLTCMHNPVDAHAH